MHFTEFSDLKDMSNPPWYGLPLRPICPTIIPSNSSPWYSFGQSEDGQISGLVRTSTPAKPLRPVAATQPDSDDEMDSPEEMENREILAEQIK